MAQDDKQFSVSIDINAPADRVYEVMADTMTLARVDAECYQHQAARPRAVHRRQPRGDPPAEISAGAMDRDRD